MNDKALEKIIVPIPKNSSSVDTFELCKMENDLNTNFAIILNKLVEIERNLTNE